MSQDARLSEALDAIFAPYNRSDAPGLVVAVARQGQVLYRRGFGLASLELGVANTPTTRLRIGSTTKHFTCLAAFLLAEEGKLDLDAPVTRYFPDLSPALPAPTLRQFMQHTGGTRDFIDLASIAAGITAQPAGVTLPAQLRQSANNFPPGTRQLYCNGSYHLLSLAIENAAGQPFAQFLKERLFAPLGMHSTDQVASDLVATPGMAGLYVPQPGGVWRRGVFLTEQILGEGGIVATVDDMLRWMAHLRAPTVVGSADTWRQMLKVAVLDNGHVSNYACGLWLTDYRGVETIHHSGSVYGGASQMLTVPSEGLDLIILTNGAPAAPTELAKQVLDAVLGDKLQGCPPKMADSAGFEPLFGHRYHSASGLVIGFDDVGGKLGVSFLGGAAIPMLRDEGETLRIGFEDVAMGPFVWRKADLQAGAGGAPETIAWTESGELETFRRLPQPAPETLAVAAPLLGRYHSSDLATSATLAIEGETLVLRLQGLYGNRVLHLSALDATVFAAIAADPLMPDRSAITFDTRDGSVSGFRLSTGRTRQLAFARQH